MANIGEDGVIRVIEGSDDVQEPTAELGFRVEKDYVKTKFKTFVKEFKYHMGGDSNISTLKYREQFLQRIGNGIDSLEVSLSDLNADKDSEILAHAIRTSPTENIRVCEDGLRELYVELIKRGTKVEDAPCIQLHIIADTDVEGGFGKMKPMMLRQLVSDVVETLVVVQGIVISMKTVRHKARKIVIRCSNCENQKEVFVPPGFCGSNVPTACQGNALRGAVMEKCPPNPFKVIEDLCEYVDEQSIKLQELPEDVPVGEMPRSIDLWVHKYTVDQCTPGARLTCAGVFCATEHSVGDKVSSSRQKGTNTVKYSYLSVLGVQVTQGNAVSQPSLGLTAEEEEQFEILAKDPDIHQKLFKSIAPAIKASEKDVINDVKQAVCCLLFGGSRKRLADMTRMRGDINVLLLGDPGTAKSQFLKFAEKVAPIAVYTSGKGSSAAGLTASIRSDKNGFTLEGGAMVLADGGVVCIDEFDKMDVKDRVAIHEAMEQQTISIAKAGITTMLNTRCSVLAAANPRFGTYDDLRNTAEQMDFETTILSRFDMMFLVKDVRDPVRDYNLAKHLCGLHSNEVEEESEGPVPLPVLRKYITFCRRRCAPRMSSDAADVLINRYISIRKQMREDAKSCIPITVRQLEAIIRISESLAKMQLIEDVTVAHVEEALRLFTVSTLDSANKDQALLVNQSTDAEREDWQKAEEQIRKLIAKGSRKTKHALQSLLVSTTGIDEGLAAKAILSMQKRGELIEKSGGTLERV